VQVWGGDGVDVGKGGREGGVGAPPPSLENYSTIVLVDLRERAIGESQEKESEWKRS